MCEQGMDVASHGCQIACEETVDARRWLVVGGACVPSGSSASMHVLFQRGWEIVLDDVFHVLDVDTSCGNIGREECGTFPAAERLQHR
mmetsp:Transcript_3403/g.3441  ORF Transcript_3403/g.3441 Transcript_3403/m.3441 type:complete len:88 (+) Transcript_3403:645-908(+)